MHASRGITKDLQQQAEAMGIKLPDEIVDMIAQKVESFVAGILEESLELCHQDKRKIVTQEDVKNVVIKRNIDILYPLFSE